QFAELHNLDVEQINWRRAKRQELDERFQVEYPIDADQAFLSSGFDSFFSAELVTQARRQKIEPHGPIQSVPCLDRGNAAATPPSNRNSIAVDAGRITADNERIMRTRRRGLDSERLDVLCRT